MIVHARGASQGSGPPAINKNNHPFTSSDKSIGLIHNGKIPSEEYNLLSKKYEVSSDCDSEILLRIFEAGDVSNINNVLTNPPTMDAKIAQRLVGLRDIWSFIEKGHMAVAVGERVDSNVRRLFLFRNQHRSLWIADLRKKLGQVFFCSTPEIWNDAFRNSKAYKFINERVKLIDLPVRELWTMQVDKSTPVVKSVDKYDIFSQGTKFWKPEGEQIKIANVKPPTTVITKLDENEQPIDDNRKVINKNNKIFQQVTPQQAMNQMIQCENECYFGPGVELVGEGSGWTLEDLSMQISNLKLTLDGLYRRAEELTRRDQLTTKSLEDALMNLEQMELDIDGTVKLLGP